MFVAILIAIGIAEHFYGNFNQIRDVNIFFVCCWKLENSSFFSWILAE